MKLHCSHFKENNEEDLNQCLWECTEKKILPFHFSNLLREQNEYILITHHKKMGNQEDMK